MSKCYYPDWEGGLIEQDHNFDKDGFCIICGEPNKKALDELHKAQKEVEDIE